MVKQRRQAHVLVAAFRRVELPHSEAGAQAGLRVRNHELALPIRLVDVVLTAPDVLGSAAGFHAGDGKINLRTIVPSSPPYGFFVCEQRVSGNNEFTLHGYLSEILGYLVNVSFCLSVVLPTIILTYSAYTITLRLINSEVCGSLGLNRLGNLMDDI